MPTYEYECKSCGHTFEAFQPMSDAPLKDCPQCGKEIRRLIHGGTGVIFKGAGFYVTDKGKGSNAAGKNSKPAESSSTGDAASGSAVSESAAAGTEKSPAPESAAKKDAEAKPKTIKPA